MPANYGVTTSGDRPPPLRTRETTPAGRRQCLSISAPPVRVFTRSKTRQSPLEGHVRAEQPRCPTRRGPTSPDASGLSKLRPVEIVGDSPRSTATHAPPKFGSSYRYARPVVDRRDHRRRTTRTSAADSHTTGGGLTTRGCVVVHGGRIHDDLRQVHDRPAVAVHRHRQRICVPDLARRCDAPVEADAHPRIVTREQFRAAPAEISLELQTSHLPSLTTSEDAVSPNVPCLETRVDALVRYDGRAAEIRPFVQRDLSGPCARHRERQGDRLQSISNV